MAARRLLALLIALTGAGRVVRAADVIAAPLDAEAIAQMAAMLGGHRVAPGDVMLANSAFQVVVFAQPQKGDQGRVGRILFLSPTGSEETFVFEGGPINDWERGELGRGDQLALVRFQRQSKDWSAELVVQMPDKSSWLEVTTTIHNNSQNTLEIPVVDVVRGPSGARLADDKKGMIAIGKVDAPTLALLRLSGGITAAQSARGEWLLGHSSGDQRSNAVSRAGKRILHFGKSDAVAPVPADDEWSAELKDKKNWHRVPAGQSRTIHRRLVFGPTGASLRPTLSVAGRVPAPNLQFVPAGKAAATKSPTLAERAKGFVTRRPPNNPSTSDASPSVTPIPTAKSSTPPATTIVAKPTPLPANRASDAAPSTPVAAKVKPIEDTPKVINDAINQIGDLPPPIK